MWRLSNASDGSRLWTDTYRRQVADIGAIETDLEARILASLRITETPQKAHVIPDQARDYYLKARFEDNQSTPEGFRQAQQDYRRAIEIDPEYATAYADLGGSIWNENSARRMPLGAARAAEQTVAKGDSARSRSCAGARADRHVCGTI